MTEQEPLSPPQPQLPRVFVIDWSAAHDFPTFTTLWGLQHPNEAVAFKEGGFEKLSEKVRKCLLEIPPTEVARQIEVAKAQKAEAERRAAVNKSGLIIPGRG